MEFSDKYFPMINKVIKHQNISKETIRKSLHSKVEGVL